MLGIKQYSTQVGSKTVAAQCHEILEAQAQWLLDYLKRKYSSESDKIVDGFKIQIGWSILCLFENDGKLVLCEPNYQKNPFQDWRNDITDTLTVQAQQNQIMQLLGITEDIPTLFHEQIMFAKDALFQRQIQVQRSANPKDGNSGWCINRFARAKETGPYSSMYVYQLIQNRPALLQLLSLPVGYSAVIDGNDVIKIDGPDGRTWNL